MGGSGYNLRVHDSVFARLSWSYQGLSVPVTLGRTFYLNDGIRDVSVEVGLSAGVLMLSAIKISDVEEGYKVQDNSVMGLAVQPYGLIELTLMAMPLAQIPGLRIGINGGYQLNWVTLKDALQGTISDLSSGKNYFYRKNLIHWNPLQVNFVVNYTFNVYDKKSQKNNSSLNCPLVR